MRILTILVLFFAPVVTFAAGLVPCTGPTCNACDLVTLGQNILGFLIAISVFIIAIIIAVAGLKMVMAAGNVGAITAAKESITHAIIGFIIILAAWLIVDTVIKTLVNPSGALPNFGPWNQIQCQGALPPVAATAPSGAAPGSVTPTTPTTGGLTHTDALSQLQAAGISVQSSGGCSDPTNSSCTSLQGMQQSTIDKVVQVAQSCSGCALTVTSGTEIGHSNPCHQSGTCVDVKCASGCTNTQITQVFSSATSNGTRAVYETLDCAKSTSLRAQGYEAFCKSDQNYGHITGDHFSLYTNI